MTGKGWVAAGDLVVGDEVYTLDGDAGTVTGLKFEKLDKPIPVYNLEVEDFHSYFVGEGVLSHNEYKTVVESKSVERFADALEPEHRETYEKILSQLARGDYSGLNVHKVNDYLSADFKGFGGGRGGGRIFFIVKEFTIEIQDAVKKHKFKKN